MNLKINASSITMSHGSKPIDDDVKEVRKMATKGASNRYGNSRGANHQGKATEHINYQWAKDFNKHSLKQHFIDHASNFGVTSIESYKQHAIKFANAVDRKNCVSFVDAKTKATYKYNTATNTLVIVDKRGYVATYYKPKGGYEYYKKQEKEKGGKK